MTETNENITTVLVRIKPDLDSSVMALYQQASALCQYAETRIILEDGDIKIATDDLSLIAKLKKAIEEKRKEYVGPINDHLKTVNDAFKLFTEPLNKADSITRQKILDYRKEQDRIRQEQERINRLRFEAAQAESKLKGELTESVVPVEVRPEQPAHYRTEMGTLGKIKVKKWELVDFNLVPDQYKILNEVLIGKMVRAGIPGGIPGIRIWEEESLRVTTK